MCLDASTFFNKSWLASITEEPAPVRIPEHEYAFPMSLELGSLFFTPVSEDQFFWQVQEAPQAEPALAVAFTAPAPVQVPVPEPVQAQVPARVRADVWLLTLETELYASVMYDKRKQIDQHALSQV
jgi:hypothetical protein